MAAFVSSLSLEARIALPDALEPALTHIHSAVNRRPDQAHRLFDQIDHDLDGRITRQEFTQYLAKQEELAKADLTASQHLLVFVRGAIEMVGLGFSDNFIMLCAGAVCLLCPCIATIHLH